MIPLGLDNPPHGALGYMLAAREIVEQGPKFDCVVVGSGSGLTHAGLLSGFRALGVDIPVHGACVRRAADLQRTRIRTVLRKIEALLDCPPIAGNEEILAWDKALAPGYGRLGAPAREAISLLATHEGLFVDPVYTAKSLATLIDLVRTGVIAKGARVLFIHTGGIPGSSPTRLSCALANVIPAKAGIHDTVPRRVAINGATTTLRTRGWLGKLRRASASGYLHGCPPARA